MAKLEELQKIESSIAAADNEKLISLGEKLVSNGDFLDRFNQDPYQVLQEEGIDLPPEAQAQIKKAIDDADEPMIVGVIIRVFLAVMPTAE